MLPHMATVLRMCVERQESRWHTDLSGSLSVMGARAGGHLVGDDSVLGRLVHFPSCHHWAKMESRSCEFFMHAVGLLQKRPAPGISCDPGVSTTRMVMERGVVCGSMSRCDGGT